MWSTWAEKQKCLEIKRARPWVEQISMYKTCALHYVLRSAVWNGWQVLCDWFVLPYEPVETVPQMIAVSHVRKGWCFWNSRNVFTAHLKIHGPYYKRRREALWHLNSTGHLSLGLSSKEWTIGCLFLRASKSHCCLHLRWLGGHTNRAVIWITSRNVCGVKKRTERHHFIFWNFVTQGKRFWKIS